MQKIRLCLWGVINFFLISFLVLFMLGGYIFYGILAMMIGFKRSKGSTKLGFLFLLLLLGALGFCTYRFLLPAAGSHPGKTRIVIETGMTAAEVGKLLEANGLIRSSGDFRLLAKWFGLDQKLKAGCYEFSYGTSLLRLLQNLEQGSGWLNPVAIPEGLTLEQTADRIARQYDLDRDKFLALTRDSNFVRLLGFRAKTLEGYLFPETYYFGWGTSPRNILQTMADRFEVVYEPLAAASPIPLKHDLATIVTMASIVEKESITNAERPRIAAVFWNRLRIGMSLGADPTVRYALNKFTGSLTRNDLAVDSPYNTRRFRGLPPGPICNPGLKSLRAVLFPQVSRELYFVAKCDGSNEHYFSGSLEEHAQFKKKAQQEKTAHDSL